MRRPKIFHPDQYREVANLAEAFFFNADNAPDLPAYDQAVIDPAANEQPRRYVTTLQSETKDRVLKIAAHLESQGVRRGDSVAILSFDRPEWTEAEMAIHTVGGRMVGAYVRDPIDRLHHILCDSGAVFAFAENQEQLDKLLRLTGQGLNLRGIVALEDVQLPPQDKSPAPHVARLQDILAQEQVRSPRTLAGLAAGRDDVACIFYTSASTGLPKGVPVTHGQSLENLWQIASAGLVDHERLTQSDDAIQPVVTSLLPERAHVYAARVMQLVATSPVLGRFPAIVDRRVSQITPQFRDSLRRDLFEGGAHIVIVVPKILVGIEKRIRQRLASGGLRERIASLVVANAAQKLLADARRQPRPALNLAYRALTRLRRKVVQQIRERILGPQFEYFVCGGAKLPPETAAFFWALGMKVYEGYGSTETNCPIAVGTAAAHRIGTVGKLFSGVEMKVDPKTREVLIRGPNVAHGYWGLSQQSAATWTADGWYHTRDIGRLDADGFLHIEDRLDNILVLLNGEKVSAAEIEGRFAVIPYVETAIIVGHQRAGLVALVALNDQAVQQWIETQGLPASASGNRDDLVRSMIWSEIEEHVNRRAVRGFERICNVGIIEPLNPEQRTLTATEKVPRGEVEAKYKALIERLYTECGVGLDGEIALAPQLERAAAV